MPLPADDAFLPQLSRHRESGHTVVSLNVGYDAMSFENDIRVVAHFRHWSVVIRRSFFSSNPWPTFTKPSGVARST